MSCDCKISDIMEYKDGVLNITVPVNITATKPDTPPDLAPRAPAHRHVRVLFYGTVGEQT